MVGYTVIHSSIEKCFCVHTTLSMSVSMSVMSTCVHVQRSLNSKQTARASGAWQRGGEGGGGDGGGGGGGGGGVCVGWWWWGLGEGWWWWW